MKKKTLMLIPLPRKQMEQMENHFDVCKLWKEEDPEAALSGMRKDVQAIVSSNKGMAVTAKLISSLPNLEVIAHLGTGYNAIDMETARNRGIAVSNALDKLEDTADIGMGLILNVMRRMVEADMYVRTGQWEKRGTWTFPLTRSLCGRTLGIIGMGRIGQAVARRAEAFGLKVVYNSPREKKAVSYPHYANLLNMAAACDILIATCVYNETTHHLVNADVLAALGKEGVFVNISRGAVVKEDDLVEALEQGVIAGAGLDVYQDEPHVPPALRQMDNVVLSPHVGNLTVENAADRAQQVVDNLLSYFEKGEVLTPV